ncbi:AlbA family DNA-binding domain-containing protein [Parabacteroides sp.]
MKENQTTEFKESWHDEYVRYVSAFCNTDGGTLYIGIDDEGRVVGVKQTGKLIEKLPNFIV